MAHKDPHFYGTGLELDGPRKSGRATVATGRPYPPQGRTWVCTTLQVGAGRASKSIRRSLSQSQGDNLNEHTYTIKVFSVLICMLTIP